jgi:Spy/CpxP family protein refolding chaperone
MKITTKTGMTLILAAALTITGAQAFAQRQMPGPPADDRQGADPDAGRGFGAPPSEERREEIRKKMEAVRIWRMTEELKLDEKTAARFLPAISSVEQKRRELMKDNVETMKELRTQLGSRNPDERKLKASLEKLEKNQQEMTRLREKEIEAAKNNLTSEQQARYLIFQQEFQREMRGMIEGARGGGAGMRGDTGGSERGRMNPGMGPGAGPGGQGMRGGPFQGGQRRPPANE